MKRTKIALVGMALAICLLSSALALVWMQKSVTNNMTLNGQYDIAVFESGTQTPCTLITWGAFNESQVKTYIIDLQYLGNVAGGRIFWDGTNLNGWTLKVEEKNWDASSYNIWPSGEGAQITGLEPLHLKNIKLTLTETTATPLTPYAFTVTFYSLYGT
jgi:hypothetical protein